MGTLFTMVQAGGAGDAGLGNELLDCRAGLEVVVTAQAGQASYAYSFARKPYGANPAITNANARVCSVMFPAVPGRYQLKLITPQGGEIRIVEVNRDAAGELLAFGQVPISEDEEKYMSPQSLKGAASADERAKANTAASFAALKGSIPTSPQVQRTVKAATADLVKGAAIVTDGANVKLGTSGRFSGVSIAAAGAGALATIQTAGPLDPAVYNLGAGVACAVGITSAGVPVRVTSGSCVSGRSYLGYCDETGTISVLPYVTSAYRIDDWGGIPNDSGSFARIANTAAIIAIQVSLPPNRGADIEIPYGDWHFAAHPDDATAAIHLVRPVRIRGAGARYDNNFGTRLHIPDGVVGIKAWHNGMASPVGTEGSASGCLVEGLQLHAEGASSPVAHGFELRTVFELRNVVVDQFGGHGVMVSSLDETGGGFPDNWTMHSVRVAYCLDGIHVVGGDSNNGSCTLADCSLNRGWGVYDVSFLGCNWRGCHTADNMSGPYYMGSSVPSTMIGCYSESDQAPSHCERTLVVGGDHGAGFDDTSTHSGNYGELARAEFFAADYYVTDVVATGTNPPPVRITYRDLTAEQRPPTSAPSAEVIVEVTTAGWPGGRDGFHNVQTAMVVKYSIDGGSTWVTGQSPSRGDDNYFSGPARLQLGASKLYAYFPVAAYTLGNHYACSAHGGIRAQVGAGSRDGTFATLSWQHFDVSTPGADPFIWRHGVYDQATKRWKTSYAGSKISQEYVSDLSLPAPGQVVHPGPYWSGSDGDGWSRLGWCTGLPVGDDAAVRLWRLSTGADEQWYGPGDLVLNRSPTAPFPLALRAVRRGGWSGAFSGGGYEYPWAAGTGHHTSDTVIPSTPNGYLYRAEGRGTTHASVEPTWPTTIDATVTDGTVTWRCVGTHGSPFEPIGSESETMYSLDASAGGALTPALEAVNAKILKLTGAPGAAFSLVVPAGPAGAWTRTFWNSSTKDVTIKATGGDAGVVVPAGSIVPLFSDGTNVAAVGPANLSSSAPMTLNAGTSYPVTVGFGGSTPGYGIISSGNARIRWYTNERSELVGLSGALVQSTGGPVDIDAATTLTLACNALAIANATAPTITGSRASGAALADLLTKLAAMGLIIDGSSA